MRQYVTAKSDGDSENKNFFVNQISENYGSTYSPH